MLQPLTKNTASHLHEDVAACTSPAEPQIWLSFKNSDEVAFSSIFHKYYNDLYKYGLKIINDEDLVKDAIQELLITLWNSREKLADVTYIKYYLLKSLRRSLLRSIEKQKKGFLEMRLFSSNEPDILFSAEESIILEESSKEKDSYMTSLLNSLPKRQKEAIYLKYYCELEFEEVADIMGLNYQSVVNHIHRAFKDLRKNKSFSDWYQANKTF
jgi:RNA polymerase sigma factor (sigma-70 family)